MRRTVCLLGLLALTACSPSASPQAAATTGPAPVFDGFDYTPKRPIEASETYTFTAKAHATDGAVLRFEWQASGGELSSRNEAVTSWRTVKPGSQFRPGRVVVELHVAGNGPSRGGTVYMTIAPDGRASVDAFVANAFADSTGPTPTPALTAPPSASPLPDVQPEPLGTATP
ncbi:MAG: hypothetical protein JWM80_1565 [Cyanobacteria bacterium RYN_339]|nr:hypothetical protein [Cyanobacteria bacterium RYN_339]